MSTQIVAFDFGDKTLKMACFQDDALREVVVEDMPENLVVGGQISSINAMSSFLSDVAKTHNIAKRDAAVIIPSSLVSVRTLTVPVMSEHQLRYNLPYEFKDYLVEDKIRYAIDYEVLETKHDDEGHPIEQRLFACAVLKETIKTYETMFDHAGFRLKLAVPEEYIFAKLFRGDIGSGVAKSGAHALLDLGQNESRIHIIKDGEYDTKRTIDLGVADLEKLIADITFSDIHMAHNYLLSNYENVLENEKVTDFYNRLSVEVLKAVNFYNYNSRSEELLDLYLIGGGSAITPLINVLRETTNLPLHPAGALLGGDLEQDTSRLVLRAVCCAAGE